MFVREGILDPLSSAILSLLGDKSVEDDESITRAVNVLLLFCQVGQADERVRDAFASRTIMISQSLLLLLCTRIDCSIHWQGF